MLVDSHAFKIEDAVKYGVDAAILLSNLRYWLELNRANKRNVHDGYVWSYNTANALSELFPYWSANKIQKLTKKMENDGIIISGCYNEHKYDRTKWYTMPEYELSSENPSAKRLEVISQSAESSLSNINTDINNNSLRLDKSKTNIFSKDLKDSSRKFINQLSQSDYPLCFIAMDELSYLKSEYQNIYLGSQTNDAWNEAESILREICGTDEAMGMSEEEVVSTFVRVTYMKRCLNNKNEVGLPFMIGLVVKVGAESAVNPDHIDLLSEDY